MAFYFSRENYRNIVRGSTLNGSGVISTVNTGLTGQNDDEVDRGLSGPITGLTPPSILTFYTIPTQVSWGNPVSLFWTTANAVSVALNNDIGDVSSNGVSSGRYDVERLEQQTTYELTATNSSGSVKKYTVVGMQTILPVFNHFYADPNDVISGQGFTLHWSIGENPTNVSISGIGDVTSYGASEGQYRVTSITQSTIFTATATNAFGSRTKTASVTIRQPEVVPPPVIWSFYANPQNTAGTGRTTLQWGVSNIPTSVSISPDVGSLSPSATSVEVSGITDNKSYTLTVSNTGGSATRSTTVVFGSTETGNAGSTFATDFPGTNSLVSVEDMKNILKTRMLVWFNMDGQVSSVNPGARAIGFHGDDPSFSWFRFVNGNYKGASGQQIVDAAGATIDPYDTLKNTSVKEWYKWGARRFTVNLPFGKVPTGGGRKEATIYQPDSYLNARDGLNIDGITCNEPMPWLVGDFVKTWKALVSGTQGTLTNQEWNILTGNTGWFNPAQPISLMFYNGTINQENYVRWKQYGFTGAKDRLIESFQPYLETGAQIGMDALTRSPGATVGYNVNQVTHDFYNSINAPQASPFRNEHGDGTTYGSTLDAAWWSFYSTWLLPNFGQQNIYCEGAPEAFKKGNTWHNNPYFGHPFISDDEGFYQNYGNQPGSIPSTSVDSVTRVHQPSEMGQVEGIMSNFQGIRKYPIVGVSGASGFTYGRYWYLYDYAAPAQQGGVAEMDGNARVYRVVESTGYGNIQWDYAFVADKLLNKNRIRYDDPTLDETIGAAYFNWSNFFDSPSANQGEDGAYTNIGGVEDFRSRFPTIDDYAHYLAFLKSGGTPVPRGFSTGYRHPETQVDPNKIIDHTKLISFGLKNNGIENAVWIYLDELDAYTRGKLSGSSGGQLYRPSITADAEPKRIKDYLDYRYERAKETLGYYPKYFVISLTKNDGSTQPSQFQLERYLYTPAVYPNSTDYSQYESLGGSPSYDDSIPSVIDIDQTITPDVSDILISTGYLINNSDYLLTINLVNKLLTTAREWKTERGYDLKFGVENAPEITIEPRTSYTITGGGSGLTFERYNDWGGTTWTRPLLNGGSEPLSLNQTLQSKQKVRLEFSKRIEPLLENLDVLYPTVYDYYTNTNSYDAQYKAYQKEKINIANTLKAAPFSFSGDVVPLVSYSHVGNIEGGSAGNLDPITLSGGTTYDDAQVYSDIVDWVRTDHGNVVTGYSFWNDTSYAASAMGISSYVGITADRERVLKWIKSFDGAGVTIDWTNSVDVEAKIKRFYDIHSELLKRYAYRFGGESLQQPPATNTPKLKILNQGLYHPSNGNGIVQNVFDTGVSYDTLDVVPAKIFYAYSHLGISGICYGTGRYTFVSPWGNASGLGLKEPFQNDVAGNTLTAAYVNTLALTQGQTAEYERTATELLRLRFLNLDQTYDGEILKWRADDSPPLGNERLTYTGYIFPDPEIIRYPSLGKFQNAAEAFHIETCKFLNRIVYSATKQVWPSSKVGFWGECQADSEPFNDYDPRWDDFVQNPATYGAGFVDNNGVSLTVTGLTGYVNYVAEKLKYIYENACDVVSPNFYQLYGGLSGQNPLVEDIHYGQISSLWTTSTGDKIVNSRTRTYADVSLQLIKKMNELLVSEGKSRKEVYPTVWNYHLVGNQFGIDLPSTTPHGCGITFGLTADRADSMYSLRKFMEQNLGISGSTYTFWNLGHFMQNGPTCDAIPLVRRKHPELVPVDRDEYYTRFIKPSLESGVIDGFYQWNSATRYDFTYAARSKAELTALGVLNLGDSFDTRSNVAVETIYHRRYLLNEVLGLCMAGLTYGAYFNNPNQFPGATQAGFSFDTWGEYNTIGHPASKFTRHKFNDYILNHYCKYWADTAISQGIL